MAELADMRTVPGAAERIWPRRFRPPAHPRVRNALVICLTMVTGATDSIAFLRLDNVFTSVMTGNMVLMGMGIGRADLNQFTHAAIAVVSYVVGAMVGGQLTGEIDEEDGLWPRRVTLALIAELLLFMVVNAIWWIGHGQPVGVLQECLVGVAALALGVQSSAVIRLNVSGLSTTYLTGTLTGIARSLVVQRSFRGNGRSSLVLLALVSGAALGALLATQAPMVAAVPPLVILGVVLVTATVTFHGASTCSRQPYGADRR